jgi:polyisoprenoid-binding protein YceI
MTAVDTQELERPVRYGAIPAGRWVVDPRCSEIAFAARRPLAAEPVRGIFRQFDGALEIGPFDGPRAHLIIKVESLDTGDAETNASLIGEDQLDAESYPEVKLELDSATGVGQGYWQLEGRITIREQVREVDLDAVVTELDLEGEGRRVEIEILGRPDVDFVRLHLSLSLLERQTFSALRATEIPDPRDPA